MEAMMDLTEKTLSREEKYSGPLFSVHTDQVLLPNGQTSYREVVEHVDGVAVLALDERNNVLTVRQYRYVFGRTLLELPPASWTRARTRSPALCGSSRRKPAPCRIPSCPWAAFCRAGLLQRGAASVPGPESAHGRAASGSRRIPAR